MLRARPEGQTLVSTVFSEQAQDSCGSVADFSSFLEHHSGRVPVFLRGVLVSDQPVQLRPRVHRVSVVRPSTFELVPKAIGDDAHARCDGWRPGFDVTDGEETLGYWVRWRGLTAGSMVETYDSGVDANVLGEYIRFEINL